MQITPAVLSREVDNTPDKLSVNRKAKVQNKQPFRVTYTRDQSAGRSTYFILQQRSAKDGQNKKHILPLHHHCAEKSQCLDQF